jgi:hypothetical protein
MLDVRISMFCTLTRFQIMTGITEACFVDFQEENPKHENFKVCIEQSISSSTTPMTHEIYPMLSK